MRPPLRASAQGPSVILNAAKNLVIPHSADSVQNDNSICAEFPEASRDQL
jgi:hypothetical protein